MQKFRILFSSSKLNLILIKELFPFVLIDSLFNTFSMVYAFTIYGINGTLLFLAFQYMLGSIGFISAFYLIYYKVQAIKILRYGVLFCALGSILSTYFMNPIYCLIILTICGAGRGCSWAARQWLEFNHTKDIQRENYIRVLQSITTTLKVLLPIVFAYILFLSENNFKYIFQIIGLLTLCALIFTYKKDILQTASCPHINIIKNIKEKLFLKTAPFYILEGAGSALRSALYISGAMTIVKSAEYFVLIDSSIALLSACLLIYVASKSLMICSFDLLKKAMILTAICWVLLLIGLKFKLFLIAFVIAYAFSTPFLMVAKQSIILKGLTNQKCCSHNNAITKEFILLFARVFSLLVAALLSIISKSTHLDIILIAVFILILMPFEYFSAKKII